MITIDKGIPMPEDKARGKKPVYPFASMEIGDSFALPCSNEDGKARRKVYNAMYNASRQWIGRTKSKARFMFHVSEDCTEVRCWRSL